MPDCAERYGDIAADEIAARIDVMAPPGSQCGLDRFPRTQALTIVVGHEGAVLVDDLAQRVRPLQLPRDCGRDQRGHMVVIEPVVVVKKREETAVYKVQA